MSASKKLIQAAAGSAGGDFYPYTVDYSCRFNDGDSPELTWTPGGAGTSTTWTISLWWKLGSRIGSSNTRVLAADTVSAGECGIAISNDQLNFYQYTSTAYDFRLYCSRKLRDPSAWAHIVCTYDSTESTAADRLKVWINGERETAFDVATYPSLNYAANFMSAVQHMVGCTPGAGGEHFDGYLAQVCVTDGVAYTASDFGQDKNGVWVPKDVSGLTFGTNGFYLDFADSADLGNDISGNNNDFTPSGLAANDQVIDTPTNNYCVFNPLAKSNSSLTLSDGNLRATTPAVGGGNVTGTIAIPSSGKWYFEMTAQSAANTGLGLWSFDVSEDYAVQSASSLFYYQGGDKYVDGTNSAYGASYTTNDVIGVAVDVDGGTVTFYKNNSSQGSISYDATGYFACATDGASASGIDALADFGQSGFTYTPPTDHLALCTANLPEPTIGPNSTTTSGENFNTVLYTGTGASQSITGVGFQPDFIWIKRRSAIEYHWLVDVLRGVTTGLRLPGTLGETTLSDATTSFDSDGFTAGPGSGYTGASGNTYVAWSWKAGGSGVSNTDGSITSTVSANTDAGFSVALYTGTGASMTFGHGLGQALDFLIVTKRTGDNYIVYPFAATGNLTNYLQMETTSAYLSDSVCHTNSSTVIGFNASGARNSNGVNYVAYCFVEVEGFSKFGAYTGNGSADGPMIVTGFRPAFVLTKRTDAAGYNWVLMDSGRDTYNVADAWLYPNSTSAEVSNSDTRIDFLSNGFKLRGVSSTQNTSGGSYIYMAFAENPFKYANAR